MARTEDQKRSDAQEKRTAKRFNGSVTPGSGRGWKFKHDVRTEHFLIENKTRRPDGKSYTVNAVDLRDLNKRAIMDGKTGLLQFDLGGHSYVILREDDFIEGMEDG